MDEALADETVNIWVRRAQLRKLDGKLGRLLNRLDEAVPRTLIVSYAQELRSGVKIPERPAVSETINRFLSGYAGSMDVALAGTKSKTLERPAFPSRTGALDTFAYAAKFAPIFLLAFLIDVTFPIALWAYTIMGLDWKRYQENPDEKRGKRRHTDLDDLTELKAVDLQKDAKANERGKIEDLPPQPRPPHRPNGRKRSR